MGKRGPGKKPTVLKMRDGVDQVHPERINRAEAVCDAVNTAAPTWMSVDEKAKWAEVVQLLEPTAIMTQNDRDVVALYCTTWCKWLDAHLKILRYGAVLKVGDALKRSPYAREEAEMATRCRHLMGVLGLTPSGRAGIAADGPGLAKRDAFAEMFRKQYG